jgi:diacylglycerol kinase family enzyme
LRIPTAPKRAARLLLDGEARPIDLGRCEDRTFATVAAFGFDAEVSQSMMDGQVPLSGTAGYLYATVRQLRAYRPPRVRVTGDFGELQQPVFLAATANTPFYGGGMRIVPAADPTDGLLDLCLIDGDVSAATVMAMLPRIFWGGHVRHPAVRQLRSSFVELEALDGPRIVHADGEHLTESPAVLRVEPAAVHVIQPTETGSKASYSGPAQLDR